MNTADGKIMRIKTQARSCWLQETGLKDPIIRHTVHHTCGKIHQHCLEHKLLHVISE